MKDFFLTDIEIEDLVNEPKQINQSIDSLIKNMKIKQGRNASFKQNSCKFPRQNGKGKWLLYIRLSLEDPLDFSCGLKFIPENRKEGFRLRRYNGKSHLHANRLEKERPFQDFHIHIATEEYQRSSFKDDHYAEPTDRYVKFKEALECLFNDCKIQEKTEAQQEMFQ